MPLGLRGGLAIVTPETVIDEVDAVVRFTRRPVLVTAASRVPWRLSILCLVLSRFRNNSARVEHVHLINWALTTPTTRALMQVWLSGIRPMDSATVRIDPALQTTLTIGLAEGLIEVLGNAKVQLSARGLEAVREIDSLPNLLKTEKTYLAEIGPLTETGLTRRIGAVPT